MGCCNSRLEKIGNNKVKNSIDAQLELSSYQDKLQFKILLLGSGESGKSTVLKGIKIINKIQMTDQELLDVANSLRRNVVQCMNVLIEHVAIFGYEVPAELKPKMDHLVKLNDGTEDDFTTEAVDYIMALWKDEVIQKVWARRKEYWILDSAEYYFNNVERFGQDDFKPTEEDAVMARVMTTGIITTEVKSGPVQFSVIDVGGQRNERRKWIHTMDNCSLIVYVVNLAGYNSVLFEDQTQNRMVECLTLFQQQVNNPLFATTPFFVLFNKKDLFEAKIREDPITTCPCFTDYTGSGELRDCLTFVENKFREQIKLGSPDRLKVFHIAARLKQDIREVWEELVQHIRTTHKKDIDTAIKYLEKQGVLEPSSAK
ncbi:G-protein subunit alpha 8 [Cladochytrium replicatum]|nr:G-protein subunit alpha 8 [Cladochytrium replicatum]